MPSGNGTRRSPGRTEMTTSSTPGTAFASATPVTPWSVPAFGIGSITTPEAPPDLSRLGIGSPAACRKSSSSSDKPTPKRRVREQRPPMERAATSRIQGPFSLRRSSAWMGPSVSPSAAAALAAQSTTSRWRSAGNLEGVTYSVSSK